MIRKHVLLLFALIQFAACSAQTTYVLNKGSHYSKPKTSGSHGNLSMMEKVVTFDSTCLYQLGTNDDSDINKLFGYGIGLTSYHSLRIGWNCKSQTGIDLYAYVHYKGKRWVVPKDSLIEGSGQLIGKGYAPGIPIYCSIHQDETGIDMIATQGTRVGVIRFKFRNFPSGWGWNQGLYFGGTTSCPHTMTVIIE